MKEVIIITKPNCAPCIALKAFVSSLDETCQQKFSILDETTSSMTELHSILESYGSYGFPTIVLEEEGKEDRLITGFGSKTAELIKTHISC